MNGPGFGDAATFGPFVRDPADYRGGPDDDAYTTAGLLHEVNRLIAKANDAMAAKNEAGCKTYLRLLAGEIQHALGYHD